MKSLITKRQLLFVILVLLCGINPIYADTSKKLYVNCGNLSDLLPERERFKITDLTLSGQLTFVILRLSDKWEGVVNLTNLDITDICDI